MVYYRKYRPQKIEELDSSVIREKLYSSLNSPSVAHAFLFTGPKGLGKTSTARIVAKVLNCQKRLAINKEHETKNKEQERQKVLSSKFLVRSSQDIEPCNKCDQCISITNGTNLDVLEIDGASNRGIDEIRDLREKVKLSPAASRKKVYIIDEVHMLTNEAFNALLKTLEEPPNHVVFVLCTTEPHKVPSTIASRCFHVQFGKATPQELLSSFERIIKSEKLVVDSEALHLIANMSDGSFRDGSKILEEMVLASKGGKLTKELVEKKYQISNISTQISQMLEMLIEKDTKKALGHVSKLTEQGVDMGYFIQQMIQTLHGHFLFKAGVHESSKFEVRNSKFELGIEETKGLIELLSKAYGELKFAVLPQLPLEMAIVEWGLMRKNSHRPLNDSSSARGPATPFPPVSAPANLASRRTQMRAVGNPSSRVTPRLVKTPRVGDSTNLLQDLISKVKSHNHSIAGLLRGCKIISYDNKSIVIETNYKFHKDRLDEKKSKGIIEKACEEINGNKIEVSVRLRE